MLCSWYTPKYSTLTGSGCEETHAWYHFCIWGDGSTEVALCYRLRSPTSYLHDPLNGGATTSQHHSPIFDWPEKCGGIAGTVSPHYSRVAAWTAIAVASLVPLLPIGMAFLLDGWFKTDEDDINDLPPDLRDIYVNPWKVGTRRLFGECHVDRRQLFRQGSFECVLELSSLEFLVCNRMKPFT